MGKTQRAFSLAMKKANKIGENEYTCTTAKRQSVTPPDGVYIYDEDVDQLFIGDGATVGGVPSGVTKGKIEIFDDFVYQTITEADTPWILNSGSGQVSTDPAIATTNELGGVIQITGGSGGGGLAASDGGQIVCDCPVQADNGGVAFETRLHIDTLTSDSRVVVGLTDSQALEAPASVTGTTITTTASDGAFLIWDSLASSTAQYWHYAAVSGDTEATGNAASTVAPTADTYQTLKVTTATAGSPVKFYIDGTKVGEVTVGLGSATNLYGTVYVSSASGGALQTVDVDYMSVSCDR